MYRFSPGSCNFAEYSYILYLCAYSNEHLRTPTPTRISANCWVVKYRNLFKLELFQQYDFCSLHFTSADFKCQIHFLFSDDPPTIVYFHYSSLFLFLDRLLSSSTKCHLIFLMLIFLQPESEYFLSLYTSHQY